MNTAAKQKCDKLIAEARHDALNRVDRLAYRDSPHSVLERRLEAEIAERRRKVEAIRGQREKDHAVFLEVERESIRQVADKASLKLWAGESSEQDIEAALYELRRLPRRNRPRV